MTNAPTIRAQAVQWVQRQLQRRHIEASPGIRVGRCVTRRHSQVIKGRRYTYEYQTVGFNCHSHGRLQRLPEVMVLVEWGPRPRCWVVPRRVLQGRYTVQIHKPEGTRSIFAKYRDNWGVLTA